MPTAKATKASDKAQICRKLVLTLQKVYGKSVPKVDLPVLETLLFSICLEDNAWEAAEAGYRNLLASYFDLNEIRVSSVTELEQILKPLKDADWKGLRIRAVLRHVFESTYSFDFEKFRRLTQEVAVKSLKKITDLSPFAKDFAIQQILGSHMVCLDASMLAAARWLGLTPAALDATAAGEYLKGGLKKSEVAEFSYLLRCLAVDARYVSRFAEPLPDGLDMGDVQDRWTELQSPSKRKPARVVEKVVEPPAAARDKTVPKNAPARTAGGKPTTPSSPVKGSAEASDRKAIKKNAPAVDKSNPNVKPPTSTRPNTVPPKKNQKPADKLESSARPSANSARPSDRKSAEKADQAKKGPTPKGKPPRGGKG